MKRARKIPPSHACDFYPPSKAAEEPVSPAGSVIHLSRSDKRETSGVVFDCICGERVHGVMLFVNGIPTVIKCGNCGCLHKPQGMKLVTANFGNDCTHPVKTYDCEHHEFTCHECHAHIPGTLKFEAPGTNLPDGTAVGGVVGSASPLQEGER